MSTLSEILTMVRAEAGHSLTAAHQAQSDAVLTSRINTAQRELAMQYQFNDLHLEQDVTLVAGTNSYSFPSKIGLNQAMSAWCSFGSEWFTVAYGVGLEEQSLYSPTERAYPVEKWEVRISPTDATQSLIVWPTPSQAGTLRLSGQKTPADMSAGADVSTLDGTMIAFWVAGQLLARAKQPDAEMMLSRARSLAETMRMRQSATQEGPNFGRRRGVRARPYIDFIPTGG